MNHRLITRKPLFIPEGIELITHVNTNIHFHVDDLRLKAFRDKASLRQEDKAANIGHLQALLESPQEIPRSFCHYTNIAPGSVLRKGSKFFFPAITSDHGRHELFALTRRDKIEWEIILVDINSPTEEDERVILLR